MKPAFPGIVVVRSVCCCFAFVSGLSWAAAPIGSVAVQEGNIVYTAPGGATEALTETGADDAPAISPAGDTVAFTRQTRGVDEAHDSPAVRDLWVIHLKDHKAVRLVTGKREGKEKPEQVLADIDHPIFSPDGATIYFLTAASDSTAAVHAVSTSGGAQRFVADANSLSVVSRGKYLGSLLVEQHRPMTNNEAWDPEVLISPGGKTIKVVGEDPNALRSVESEKN
jgi:Tol biopolymer transport system component